MSTHARNELFARCVAAAEASGAPQVEQVRRWSEGVPEDPGELPERTELEAHDARKYKGGPPRHSIGPGKNLWDALEERVVSRLAEPRSDLSRPVMYEFFTGLLVQRESARARKARIKLEKRKHISSEEPGPEQPFRELLRGVLPRQAIAEEALIQAFDSRGPFRKEASFFAHLYCDREANAYEGITLFDMWSLDDEFEVPDPDARAYAQLLWDDDSVPVPLSNVEHDLWYPRMADSYVNLRTHMFTTRALAAVWMEGRPQLFNGYASSIDIMNAVIALCDSDPAQVAERLNTSGAAFLSQVKAEIGSRGNEVWNAGNARRDEHAAGKQLVREAVLMVLREEGLL